MPDSKPDFLGQRVNDSGKIFGWIKENPLAFLCTFLTVTNIIFIWAWMSAKNENIEISNKLNKDIQQEIRNQLPQEVRRQVQPIEKDWGKSRDKIDTLVKTLTK